MSSPLRVLVADDQHDVLEALRLLLKAEGFGVITATSPAAALHLAGEREPDVVLMDLNYTRDTTSGQEGLDLLARLGALDPHLPVVVMTAWASVELAVEAMRRGARDFVEKPWDNARLLSVLRNQAELARALARGRRLAEENRLLRGDTAGLAPFVAASPAMRRVEDLISRLAAAPVAVLLTGENGTGKGLVARRLHALSVRAEAPFVTVDLGALAEPVFASELFGHVRGAYTDAKTDREGRFELADGGTLFLDEIANVPPAQQAKLLRAVETGEIERVGSSRTRRVDVRVIAATNADLAAEVAAGRFRQDLLFRLNTVAIHLPPLRERREDIAPLARGFLTRHQQRYRKDLRGFTAAALAALAAHPWPGNVRELDHAVERAVLLARGEEIDREDLGLAPDGDATPPPLDELTLEEVERLLIRKALERCHGSVSEAARALGLSRSALYRRLEKHDV